MRSAGMTPFRFSLWYRPNKSRLVIFSMSLWNVVRPLKKLVFLKKHAQKECEIQVNVLAIIAIKLLQIGEQRQVLKRQRHARRANRERLQRAKPAQQRAANRKVGSFDAQRFQVGQIVEFEWQRLEIAAVERQEQQIAQQRDFRRKCVCLRYGQTADRQLLEVCQLRKRHRQRRDVDFRAADVQIIEIGAITEL
jgi:hypothetical protein